MKAKDYTLIFCSCLVLALSSCRKDNDLTTPVFEVSADKTNVAVNEQVTFRFTGIPNNISFYSGEAGREYDNTQRLSAPDAMNWFSFTSQLTALAAGNTGQTDNFRIFVSNDFSGQVDSLSIRKATWTDITGRAKLPAATSTAATISDTVRVSDLRNARDTVFIAFRYRSTVSSNASRARKWTMSKFMFQNKFPNGVVYNHNTADTDNKLSGFNTHSFKGTSSLDSLKWNNSTSAVFEAGVNGLSDEDWLISKGFKTSAINPDKAVGIKKNSGTLTEYIYKFAKKGVYKVTFVANNANAQGIKEVVRQLTVTVN
jgi:hypothetical protein